MLAFCRALTLGFAMLTCAAPALAQGTPIPHGTLELIAEKEWVSAGGAVDLGLRFQLEKGWHVYWINPGDSGEPPRVEWQLPSGLTAGAIEWPTPQRFQTSSSIVDYGYVDSVLLMVPLHVNADVEPATAHIGAAVRLLICSHEMCVPGKAQLSLALPVQSQPAPRILQKADLFAATRKVCRSPRPRTGNSARLMLRILFVLSANFQQIGRRIAQAIFFPLAESQIENAAPQELLPQADGFRLTLRKSDQLLRPLDRLKGVLVLSR
jgi:DsbC/DsbD-like thiol-disulfide interchange protein